MRSELLHLEKLKRILHKHAVLHFPHCLGLGALPIAIRLHCLEIVGQKCGIGIFVLFLKRCPRRFHFRLQHLGQLGLSAGVLGW